MAHVHSLYDTDAHFKIDEHSREILNAGNADPVLFQGDHNSEVFTFELPKLIDGHDMSLCNSVKIHYSNIGAATRYTYDDVYEVTDLQVSPDDENVLVCSWLITSNATRYVGSLQFSFSFKCTNSDGDVEYAWSTAICKDVTIRETLNNSEQVVGTYSDVLENWRTRLFENRNDTLVVHMNWVDDARSYYADKTSDEILNAINNDGYACILVDLLLGSVFSYNAPEVVNGKEVASFVRFDYNTTNAAMLGIHYRKATVFDDGRVTIGSYTPAKTPNPCLLTINGTSYDGSKEVSIDIESGGSASKYAQPDWGAEDPIVVLPEATYSIAPDSGEEAAMIATPFSLEAGQTYSVSYNGVEYKCVASVLEDGVVVGNIGFVLGYNASIEPFIIINMSGEEAASTGIYGGMYMLDGSTSATVSITKHAIHEIPGDYVDIGSVMRVNLNEAGDAIDKTFMEIYNHVENGGMVTLVELINKDNMIVRKFFYPSGIVMGLGDNGLVGTMEFINPGDRSNHTITSYGAIDNLD